ncbi:MAG: EutP/PduV family microcompartment system protein [Clostridiales bacterium]|jgi:ethanolamine utilization protein EutP|nr:EutP/PduV family microcompartment system protein [Clostridiales bacterium]
MKTLLLVGRSGAGKTTLTQALKRRRIRYQKTQTVVFSGGVIDPPGEYAEEIRYGRALALYSFEADVVGLVLAADEEYSLYPPCCTAVLNREAVGIVTKTDAQNGGENPERAAEWLRLAGCEHIYFVDSVTGEGVNALRDFLKNNKKQKKST